MQDYLIVGAGLCGSVIAHELNKSGKNVFLIDKRNHIGGNCYTELTNGIMVHKYGPHIFHTNNKVIWEYVRQFSEFNTYVHKVRAKYNDDIYTLPINLSTFAEIFGGDITPQNMKDTFELFTQSKNSDPLNLEEYILTKIPKSVYNILIKGYTEKHWGKSATRLPASIIKRLPIRYNFDDRYWNDDYQGIPMLGYTNLILNMLEGISVDLNSDFSINKSYFLNQYKRIIYTGCIDEFFNYDLGVLEYRSLDFVEEELPIDDFQGISQMNYTSIDTPYTRIVEHKHFVKDVPKDRTIITYEYPANYEVGKIPYYPIRDEANTKLYNGYVSLGKKYFPDVVFCGRLGSYQYYNMDQVVAQALSIANKEKEL